MLWCKYSVPFLLVLLWQGLPRATSQRRATRLQGHSPPLASGQGGFCSDCLFLRTDLLFWKCVHPKRNSCNYITFQRPHIYFRFTIHVIYFRCSLVYPSTQMQYFLQEIHYEHALKDQYVTVPWARSALLFKLSWKENSWINNFLHTYYYVKC